MKNSLGIVKVLKVNSLSGTNNQQCLNWYCVEDWALDSNDANATVVKFASHQQDIEIRQWSDNLPYQITGSGMPFVTNNIITASGIYPKIRGVRSPESLDAVPDLLILVSRQKKSAETWKSAVEGLRHLGINVAWAS